MKNDTRSERKINHKRFFALIAVLVIISMIVFFYDRGVSVAPTTALEQSAGSGKSISKSTREEIALIIKRPDGRVSTRRMSSVPSDTTAFDLFALGDIDIEYEDYSFGKLVTSIDGVAQGGEEDKYWIWYINGSLATVGADGYIVQPGDEITWKYEKNIYK